MTAPNLDKSIALLLASDIDCGAVNRIIATTQANSELFDAASFVMEWMLTIPPASRPIAKFNRLADALNGVREAHQMEPEWG